jgi:RNA polymerase sigma-70 factor (ECF subfamily)
MITQPAQAHNPETEWIARAIEGDASAFGELYERYLDPIYRYVYYGVTDHQEAEDLTELVFLKAWEALPRYRRKRLAFRAWLYRIAHNVVVDRHRTHRPAVSMEHVMDLQDTLPTPETAVETQQEIDKLSTVLAQLKPRLKQVILCRFISGLSHAETAEAMGISEGNVRVLQHRALKKMRRLWAEEKR